MQKTDSITAIVIAYNGIRFIPDCLATLTAELSGHEHEIIVVDNQSTDSTVAFIESHFPGIQIIRNQANLGFARAINQGIAASSKEILWLLNQDIRIRKGCLEHLINCMNALPKPGIIGPRLIGFDGKLQKSCRRFPAYHHLVWELTGFAYLCPRSGLFNNWKMGEFDHLTSRPVDQPMGAAMLVSRAAIDAVGTMDESFGIFFNDVDLCYRFHAAGLVNFYCADAVIEHYVGGSVSQQKPKMVWLSHWGMTKYFLKRGSERKSSMLIKASRRLLAILAGTALMLTAIPRSGYHLMRKII